MLCADDLETTLGRLVVVRNADEGFRAGANAWADDFPEDWGIWVVLVLRNCCAPS